MTDTPPTTPATTEPLMLAGPIDQSLLPQDGLLSMRIAALDAFNKAGLPSRRHEEWRYTSLKALSAVQFLRPDANRAAPTLNEAHGLTGLDAISVVVIDGRPALEPSVGDLPDGVTITRLSDAPEHAQQHFANLTPTGVDAFTDLNTALCETPTVITVARGCHIDRPIHLSWVTTSSEPLLISPRTLIYVAEGAEVTFIEEFISTGDATHFTNAVTELHIGDGARVHHHLIERENPHTCNISTLKSRQGTSSFLGSHSVLLGGSLVRNNVHPCIDGPQSHSLLNGIYIGQDSQHLDNHMRVEHNQPNCDSRQYYRGVLCDKSHGVFSGRIVVAPDAQKTDAVQSSQSLLLSEESQIQNKPQLEIYADDVKCTHGATVGQLDADALFYLQSRGLAPAAAETMLVFAFVSEGLQRIENPRLRSALTTLVLQKLPNGEALEDIVLFEDDLA